MSHTNGKTFVSESLKPDVASTDASAMVGGGPGLPRRFTWRGNWLEIAIVTRTWRETGPCRHGSAERYVRKHWYEVETTDHRKAQLYFERQARGSRVRRWWLYSIEPAAGH